MLLDLKEFSHTRLLPRQRARTITRWTSPVQFRLGIKATVCGCRSAQWMNRDDDGLLWYCKVTILWPFIRLEKYRALIITTGGTGDEWVDGVPYLSTGHFFSHSSASSFYLWGRVTQWPAALVSSVNQSRWWGWWIVIEAIRVSTFILSDTQEKKTCWYSNEGVEWIEMKKKMEVVELMSHRKWPAIREFSKTLFCRQ